MKGKVLTGGLVTILLAAMVAGGLWGAAIWAAEDYDATVILVAKGLVPYSSTRDGTTLAPTFAQFSGLEDLQDPDNLAKPDTGMGGTNGWYIPFKKSLNN